MKIQPYRPPTVQFVPREVSVHRHRKHRNRKTLSSNCRSESKLFDQTSVSFVEKRRRFSKVKKHPTKDQSSNISSISYGGTECGSTANCEGSLAINLSINQDTRASATRKGVSLRNSISNNIDKLSLGNVDDMKHHSNKKKDREKRVIKWFCKPWRICCLMLLCLLLAAIPIAIIFGLRNSNSRETNRSLTCKTILTFENLPNQTSTTIPNGYGGLNWWNIGTLVAISRSDGYPAAMISPSCVTFNPAAQSGSITPSIVSTTFSLVSFYVSAAWLNETNLAIMGSRTGMQIYSTNVVLFTRNVTLVTLNWADVDNVTVTAFSPAINNFTWYSMDNLCLG